MKWISCFCSFYQVFTSWLVVLSPIFLSVFHQQSTDDHECLRMSTKYSLRPLCRAAAFLPYRSFSPYLSVPLRKRAPRASVGDPHTRPCHAIALSARRRKRHFIFHLSSFIFHHSPKTRGDRRRRCRKLRRRSRIADITPDS